MTQDGRCLHLVLVSNLPPDHRPCAKVSSTNNRLAADTRPTVLDLKMAEEENGADITRRQQFAALSADKRKSMAAVLGKEGKFVAASAFEGKSIGVFTSGGDAQGNISVDNFYLHFLA